MRLRTRILALGLAASTAASIALAAAPARAQGAEDKAAAEALFDEGKRLFLQKKYAEACPRLESSQRLDPGIGTLLYLADCYEGLGRVASAWATFREAASGAHTAGQADRERIARARAALLEPKLFKLTFAVAGTPPQGLKIRRNDVEVRKELWGVPVPIDPGAHTIEVTAPGKKPWTTKLDIPSGAGERAVPIPELADEPAAPPPPAKDAGAAPPPPPPADTGSPDRGRNQRIAGFAVGGAGLGGVLIGSVFGALAFSRYGDSQREHCDGIACDSQKGINLIKDARSAADVSTVAFIAGGVAVATGLVLVLTAPSSKKSAPTQSGWVTPMVGNGITGIVAGRAF